VTPQEEQLLNSLVERVNRTQLQEKDPDAEGLLTSEFGSNPDALYILAQTILVQNIALEQAKAQVTQLQQQVQQARQQPAHSTSFLGNLLGRHDPPPPPPTYAQPEYIPPPPPPPVYAQPQYQQPQYVPVQTGQPSFLRGAMQTAAGVAAGALAFEGVEAVLHGIGGGGPGFGMGGFGMGPGMGMMGGGFERPVEETVINNYYDQPGGGGEHFEHGGAEHGGFDQGNGGSPFHESAGQSDQGGAGLSEASYDTTGDTSDNDQGNFDQGGMDDSSSLDDTAMNDGGGFDDGGGGFVGDSGGDLS
jgi:uncharacterized protein